jgi:hypothetical protein
MPNIGLLPEKYTTHSSCEIPIHVVDALSDGGSENLNLIECFSNPSPGRHTDTTLSVLHDLYKVPSRVCSPSQIQITPGLKSIPFPSSILIHVPQPILPNAPKKKALQDSTLVYLSSTRLTILILSIL